jgi:hypothetical protein
MVKFNLDKNAVSSLLDTLVYEADLRIKQSPITGKTRKGETRSAAFLNAMDTILSQKRPSDASTRLIPISSKTNKLLTSDEVETLTKQAIANGVAIAEEFIFIESTPKSKAFLREAGGFTAEQLEDASIRWGQQSAVNTSVGGTRSRDPFSIEYSTINIKYIIKNCPQPTGTLEAWAKKIIVNQVIANPLQRLNADNKPYKWGLIVASNDILSLYTIKVTAPYSPGFGISNDIENYKFSEVEGPFNNVVIESSDQKTGAANLAIAHMKSVIGSKGDNIAAYYDEVIKILEEKIKKTSNTQKLAIYQAALSSAQETATQIKQNIARSRGYSTMLSDLMDPTSRLPIESSNLLFKNAALQIQSNGDVTIAVYGQDKVGNLTQRSLTFSSTLWVAQALSSEDIETLSSGYSFFNSGVQQTLETMYGKDLVKTLAETATSLSPVNYALLTAFGTIFNSKKMFIEAKKQAPKGKIKKFKVKIGKIGRKVNTKTIRHKKTPKSKLEKATPKINKITNIKGTNYVGNIVNQLDNNSSNNAELLSIINANLKQEVINAMKFPALINRTETFAGSVRAISIANSQLNFIYQPNPYIRFAEVGGEHPWNSPEDRHPANIIKQAVLSIQAKYRLTLSVTVIRAFNDVKNLYD